MRQQSEEEWFEDIIELMCDDGVIDEKTYNTLIQNFRRYIE